MRDLTVFVLGALAGAVATALYTPVTGAELRARIRIQLQKRGILEPDKIDEASTPLSSRSPFTLLALWPFLLSPNPQATNSLFHSFSHTAISLHLPSMTK